MISWQRATYLLALAILEAAPATLLVTLVGGNVWLPLLMVALTGVLATRLAARWLPEALERVALVGVAVLAGALVFKGLASGVFNPFGGWNINWNTEAGNSYVGLLGALYTFWRGTMLEEHDALTVARHFIRTVIALVVVFGFGALGSALSPEQVATAGGQILGMFAAGLLAIALANVDDNQGDLNRLNWRGVATLGATISGIVIVGLLASSVFGGFALTLLSALVQVVVIVLAILSAPFIALLSGILSWFVAALGQSSFAEVLGQLADNMRSTAEQNSAVNNEVPAWVSAAINAFCFGVPFLLLVALFLIRRRPRRTRSTNEQRESLASWGGLAADIRDMFNGWRSRRNQEGLRAALTRIQGNDPASRIRRSYIRLLLAAQAQDAERADAQTVREFAPSAAQALQKSAAVTTLTAAYERARYAPATTTANDAQQAEQAWKQIEKEAGTQ